jgi:hypothetical protein
VLNPVSQGGPVFQSVELIGRQRVGSRIVYVARVARVIPDMLSPRGLDEVLLVTDSGNQIARISIPPGFGDVQLQANGYLRIGDTPPILVHETHLSELSYISGSDLIVRGELARYSKAGVSHLLKLYQDKGREYLLNTTLPELFKSFSGEYTYLFERVSNSLIASKSKSTSSAYLLPKSIVRYSVCEITAFDVLPPVFWDSKYWEVRVKAVLQSSDARDVSVHFLVKGSDVDMDRICEVELVNVEPVPVR